MAGSATTNPGAMASVAVNSAHAFEFRSEKVAKIFKLTTDRSRSAALTVSLRPYLRAVIDRAVFPRARIIK
ncbi:NADH-ubiquinone oxidoreductase [Fulvimarina pelagi HTCC2506]|uniref:NADH-ubiquinone oxidoreductase n=1 Tax=Fulvimarina pelagi HTCC2506 TaxID=314231 RepID=Q0G6Y9_9HYPH|nr:NADH-ubiquinone oxidoreductase [Fulvimarina pelagi HTCC2506]